jgi:hypothetical protein
MATTAFDRRWIAGMRRRRKQVARHDGRTEFAQRPARSRRGAYASRAHDSERRVRQIAAAFRFPAVYRRGGGAGHRRTPQRLHDRRRGVAARHQFRSADRSDRARGGDTAAPRNRALLRGARHWRRYRDRSPARRLCAAHSLARRRPGRPAGGRGAGGPARARCGQQWLADIAHRAVRRHRRAGHALLRGGSFGKPVERSIRAVRLDQCRGCGGTGSPLGLSA